MRREEDGRPVKQSVLVAGFATRHVAMSAYRAGYTVYAVDHFCDRDLSWYTKDRIRFEELDGVADAVSDLCSRHQVDLLVVTSGAEDLTATVPVTGTPPEHALRFLDKLEMQYFLEDHSLPVPPLAAPGTYPAMLKPRRGAGGWRNTTIHSDDDVRAWEEAWQDVPYLTQTHIDGIPASVSCVSDGREARAVAVNEQILRAEGESAHHGFSGSVTPFDHRLAEEMTAIAEEAVAASGCVGSVGVDFMLEGSDAWVIEINPRFQATLDTVEAATGRSVFQMHIDACMGRLPARRPAPLRYAARRIIFADHDLTVRDDLTSLAPAVADIPWKGTGIAEGHAVVSVCGVGTTREASHRMLDKTISQVHRYMGQW